MRKWLKEFRDERRLTQEQVALLAGISRSHYTHIEKGNKTPSPEVAQAIARVLKFKWTTFFENECSPREQKEVG